MEETPTVSLEREKNAGEVELLTLKRRYMSAGNESEKHAIEASLGRVTQRIIDLRRELGKRMQHQRNRVMASSDSLHRALEKQWQNNRNESQVSSFINHVKRLDGVKNTYVQGKLRDLQTRFSQQKKVADDGRIEDFTTIEEAARELRMLQTELDDTRRQARGYMNQLQTWRARALNASDMVSRDDHRRALQMMRNESLALQATLQAEIDKLNGNSLLMASRLRESARQIEELRARVMFPRSFIDPISRDVLVDPVCDDDGQCFNRATIDDFFEKRARSDGSADHPLTRARVTRSSFKDARALRGPIKELVVNLADEVIPENVKCPITKATIQIPVCNFSGLCFEKAALDDLFDQAEAMNVPAKHPDTGEVLFRNEFTTNERLARIFSAMNPTTSCVEVLDQLRSSQEDLHKTQAELSKYSRECQESLMRGQQQLNVGQQQLDHLTHVNQMQQQRGLQLEEEVRRYKQLETDLKHQIMIHEAMRSEFIKERQKATDLADQIRALEAPANIDELADTLSTLSTVNTVPPIRLPANEIPVTASENAPVVTVVNEAPVTAVERANEPNPTETEARVGLRRSARLSKKTNNRRSID